MTMVRARKFIPEGSFTLSKRPDAFPSEGCPQLALRGDGPYVIDTGNRKYLDWICGLGALTVGHNHPHVVEAVVKQVRDGAIFSLPSKLEGQVAERLCELIPCAEQIKVVKTGSEACAAAVRVARAATGRDVIVKFKDHYHGWHDWSQVVSPVHPGAPEFLNAGIRQWSELLHPDAIEIAIGNNLQPVAAVILEPERFQLAQPGQLQALVDAVHRWGALVIFDETLSGGRLTLGGVQQWLGVTPDLAVYGKAFGGGLPFAFIAGSRELMQHAWPVSGTFSGDAVGLAACNAMLDLYTAATFTENDPGGYNLTDRMWRVGAKVRMALEGKAKALGLPVTFGGHSPRFWIKDFGPDIDRRQAMSLFVQKCAEWGVLAHQAVVFASAAMNDSQVDESIQAMEHALNEIAHKVPLRGEPYKDSVR